MDKHLNTFDTTSSTKLTEENSLVENESDLGVLKIGGDSSVGLAESIEDATACLSKLPSKSKFDEFGLWTLIMFSSFVVSGALIPWVMFSNFMATHPDSFWFLFFVLGSISAVASFVSAVSWNVLDRINISIKLKLIIAFWCPVFLSLFLFERSIFSWVALSNNENVEWNRVYNLCSYLIVPCLVGASIAMGHILRKRRQFEARDRRGSNATPSK